VGSTTGCAPHAFMYDDYPISQMVFSLHYGLIQFSPICAR